MSMRPDKAKGPSVGPLPSASGIPVPTLGGLGLVPYSFKVATINYTDVVAGAGAALTYQTAIYTLPAGAKISGILAMATTPWAGTGISEVTFEMGDIIGGPYRNTLLNPYSIVFGPYDEYNPIDSLQDARFATNVLVCFVATGANLNLLTAGVISIYMGLSIFGGY